MICIKSVPPSPLPVASAAGQVAIHDDLSKLVFGSFLAPKILTSSPGVA